MALLGILCVVLEEVVHTPGVHYAYTCQCSVKHFQCTQTNVKERYSIVLPFFCFLAVIS